MVACPGDSTTELTGLGETLTVAVALRPSLEAVMVAVPDEIAVTRPSEVTVATCGRLVAHTMTRSVNGAPDASLASAVSCVVWPTNTSLTAGVMTTLAMGIAATVIDAKALRPSAVAVM